jgi:hypothetical protein
LLYCCTEDWCECYYIDHHDIHDCESQNPSIMTTSERVWFLLSQWPEYKLWCGIEFGFGDYEPYLFVFTSWAPCAPGGYLEMPTGFWPGPGEGTVIVRTDTPWSGNFVPIYYFTGYAYYYYPGQIPLDGHPVTGSAGWGNCLSPPEYYQAACLPALGIMMDGIECCASETLHVCCVCQECHLVLEPECLEMGGVWMPELDSCDPNPCEDQPSPSRTTSWGTVKALYR